MCSCPRMSRWFSLWIGFLCGVGLIVSCSPSTNSNTTTIGPAGGKVSSTDGKLEIEVPAGALATPTAISLMQKTGTLEDNALVVYTMQPDGLNFAQPAKIRLRLKTSDLPGVKPGQEVPAFALYSKNAKGREQLSDVVSNFQQKDDTWEITASLSHFSDLQVALGLLSFVAEGIDQNLTLQVGEWHPLKLIVKHNSILGEGITLIVQVSSVKITERNATIARVLGGKERGSRFPTPFHQRFGNSFKLTSVNKEFFFRATPHPVIECLKEGEALIDTAVSVREEFLEDGKLLEKLGKSLEATLTVKVKCVKPEALPPEPSDITVEDIEELKRRANGSIAAPGKQGAAVHDGKTTKRSNIVHVGDGLLDEGVFDEEESVGLEKDTETPDPTKGKLLPHVQKLDGTKKPLNLPKEAQDKSFKEIRPVCPPEKDKPCQSKQVSLIDTDGKLHLLKIDTNGQGQLVSIPLPTIPNIETAALRQTTTGYEGVVVAQGTGDVHFFSTKELTQIAIENIGKSKPGRHKVRCNSSISRCVTGNLETSELFVVSRDNATSAWKELFQEKLSDSYSSLDLLDKTTGEFSILTAHRQKNTLTRIDGDNNGKKLLKVIQTECSALRIAVFTQDGDNYVAACQVGKVNVLIRRDFTDRVPQEPVTPPQEPTAQDAGPSDTNVSDQSTPPDTAEDCSKYRFTGTDRTYPKWYAGSIENPVCSAMYDKLYERNGQTNACKTDADCKNPCRYVCCGSALRIELIVCKEGMCQLEVSSKCSFCDGVSTNFNGCGLPPEYQP